MTVRGAAASKLSGVPFFRVEAGLKSCQCGSGIPGAVRAKPLSRPGGITPFKGLLVGAPGTGKTLSSVCTGNTFQVRTLVGDLGAARASLVGESERRIRTMMDIIQAVGGKDVLFLATANRLDTLPPELQRRFNLGIWYFDVPSDQERAAIWKIQAKRLGWSARTSPTTPAGWAATSATAARPPTC